MASFCSKKVVVTHRKTGSVRQSVGIVKRVLQDKQRLWHSVLAECHSRAGSEWRSLAYFASQSTLGPHEVWALDYRMLWENFAGSVAKFWSMALKCNELKRIFAGICRRECRIGSVPSTLDCCRECLGYMMRPLGQQMERTGKRGGCCRYVGIFTRQSNECDMP